MSESLKGPGTVTNRNLFNRNIKGKVFEHIIGLTTIGNNLVSTLKQTANG